MIYSLTLYAQGPKKEITYKMYRYLLVEWTLNLRNLNFTVIIIITQVVFKPLHLS